MGIVTFLQGNVRSMALRLVVVVVLFVVMASTLVGCGLVKSDRTEENGSTVKKTEAELAAEMYDQSWRIVAQEFMDSSFNGQDWEYWHHRYDGRLKTKEDAYVAIATMLESLNDDYTRFLRPQQMKEQNMSIDSRLYGVGIQISTESGKLRVVRTLEETPADRAKVMPGDLITHINGKSTTGISVEEAANIIRGPKGTPVFLTLFRKGKSVKKKLLRDEIKLKSVYSHPLDHKEIGYVRLTTFMSENAMEELNELFEKKIKGKRALIFDLRGNYGGLLMNAVKISDMFLDQGVIVSVEGRWALENKVFQAKPGQIIPNIPMVLLIDGASASASEIVSGALKENHRATLIGVKTYGKGLVQKIEPLSEDAGMNITISRYLTPDGHDIHKKGIAPDLEVLVTQQDIHSGKDPQLAVAEKYLLKQLGMKKAS